MVLVFNSESFFSQNFLVLNLFFFCAHEYEHTLCYAVPAGPLVYFLQRVDGSLSRASPFAAVGVVVGTIYWSAVTYGAVTVMQVSEPTA